MSRRVLHAIAIVSSQKYSRFREDGPRFLMPSRPRAEIFEMKRLGAVVLALAALMPVGHAAAAPDVISQPLGALRGANRVGNATQTGTPVAPAPVVTSEAQQVLDLVNAERTSRGLVAVKLSAQLNTAAKTHTQRQAEDGALFHTDPRDGSSPGDRISRTGYRFSTWGENVAAGYRTPAAVVQGWMNSSGHCKNILNPAFTDLGVGYVSGGAVFNHFWTQVFARPSDVARPAGTYNAAWC